MVAKIAVAWLGLGYGFHAPPEAAEEDEELRIAIRPIPKRLSRESTWRKRASAYGNKKSILAPKDASCGALLW